MTNIDKIPKLENTSDTDKIGKIDMELLNNIFKSPEMSKKLVSEFKISIIATILFIILTLPMVKLSYTVKVVVFFIVFYLINLIFIKKE